MEHAVEVKEICAKKYLAHVKTLTTKIESIQDRMSYEIARLELSGVSYETYGSSPNTNPDKIPNGIIRLQERIEELDTESVAFLEEEGTAIEVFYKLSEPRAGAIYEMYYLRNKSWKEIAYNLGVSKETVRRIRNEMLPEVYDYMPLKWRDVIPKAV